MPIIEHEFLTVTYDTNDKTFLVDCEAVPEAGYYWGDSMQQGITEIGKKALWYLDNPVGKLVLFLKRLFS